MAAQLQIQLAGNLNAGPSETELNTLTERFILRPQDFRSLGAYHAGATYTYVNAIQGTPTPTSNAVLAAMQASDTPGGLVLVKKVLFGMVLLQAATGTGANVAYNVGLCPVYNFETMFVSAQDNATSSTAPKQLAPSLGCTLRTSMPPPTMNFIMPPDAAGTHATTLIITPQGTVPVVTPTIATANPLASVTGTALNATTSTVIPYGPLFQQRAGEYPIALLPLTGLAVVLTSTVPTFATAAGTIVVSVAAQWEEVLLRDYDS